MNDQKENNFFLKLDHIPTKEEITDPVLARLFLSYRGLLTKKERDDAYLLATRENLIVAYKKLEEKVKELEKFQSLTVGRELKMIELEKEVNSLLKELGRPQKYQSF